MTQEEFVPWREAFVREWALDLANADDVSLHEATVLAAQRTDADLPDGAATKGHFLFLLLEGERRVGTLWFTIDSSKRMFLDDLAVVAAERGKGYGRQALALLEDEARARGCTHISLNVYRHNPTAIALYEKIGYQTSRLQMRKRL